MSFTNAEGRAQIIADTGQALAALEVALGEAGEAYEHLDERSAELMEVELWAPLQSAYSTLKRARSGFASRFRLDAPTPPPPPAPPVRDPRAAFAAAGESIVSADEALAELQDSLLPVDVGDLELRNGLSAARRLLDPLPSVCERSVRGFGR